MAREKRGKAKKNDVLAGLTGGEGLSVSIGAMLGWEEKSEATEKTPAPQEEKTPAAVSVAAYLQSLQKAVLHRESSGRGGRTVTVVLCRPSPSSEMAEELARTMRKGLGCGSHVEETDQKIVLQGDIQDRAEAWLTKQGVKKVVRGN